MAKPINPNLNLPSAFAVDGVKTDFTAEKIQDGFSDVNPDILAGDNLNKFIDDTYKGLNYAMDGVDDLYDVTDDLKDLSNLSASGQAILDNKANKDLSNLSSTGEAHFANPDLSNLSPTGQAILENKANISLSNLSTSGDNRLHALKSYSDNGEVLTDAEGLADVVNYAHSTFDLSKFTVVGTPTITDDGIASGFSASNYLTKTIDETYDITSHTYTFGAKYTYATDGDGVIARFGRFWLLFDRSNNAIRLQGQDANSTPKNFTNVIIPTPQDGDEYYIVGSFGNSGNVRSLSVSVNGGTSITGTDTANTPNTSTQASVNIWVGINNNSSPLAEGSVDLKTVWLRTDGVLTFSGNKTGTDTYTIGGNTVTIPYTLSKTGSKIAGANSRTDVTALYNQQGYSPYYTLDEANGNFTLPQGEIYGMMLDKTVPHIIETYHNGTSWYRVWSDGWCEQGGVVFVPGQTGGQVTFIKPFATTDYSILVTNADYTYAHPSAPANSTKSTNGIVIDNYEGELDTYAYWEAKGYIS